MAFNRLWGDRIHKTVILDSSAILMLFEFSIDLEKELTRLLGICDIIIPKPIIQELEFLSKHGMGERKVKAKAALRVIKRYKTIEMKEKRGDDSVIEIATKTNGIVVTNDKILKKRLKEKGISTIFLRGKKKLEME